MTATNAPALPPPENDQQDLPVETGTSSDRTRAVITAIATALAVAPVAVATVRAVRRGWIPLGDNALFLVRSRDVLTEHHPLLGTWTSASLSVGKSINNPGPLLFDILALPAKLGGGAGIAIGVALLNTASILGVIILARRQAGTVGTVAAAMMCAGLSWTMGSELLFDPWQPNSLLFPFLLFLTSVWSLAAGDVVVLPWTVATSSIILQTHLSYSLLIPALTLAGMTTAFIRLRSWHRVRRPLVVAVVLFAVLWSQPLIEALDGGGNLVAIATSASVGEGEPVGLAESARLTAAVLALPPFWGRPAFARTLEPRRRDELPGAAAGVAALVTLGIVLSGLALRPQTPAQARAAALIALAAVALCLLTAAVLPRSGFVVPAHQLRWIWPVGVFSQFAILACLLGAGRASEVRRVRSGVVAVLLVCATALSLSALPSYNPRSGPSADAFKMPATKRLVAQLARAELRGPVVLDFSQLRFAEPYSGPVMAALQERGVEFRLEDEGWIDQLGPSRAAGDDVVGRITQVHGDDAYAPSPTVPIGARLLARVAGLSPAEEKEMFALRREVTEVVDRNGLRLNRRGRAAAAAGELREIDKFGTGGLDGSALLEFGAFDHLIDQDLVVVEPAWRERFERLVVLNRRWSDDTVALFLTDTPS